jgi:hypothetical protein
MTSIEQCIDELLAVRSAAADPKAAYVIRSRLERLGLSCHRAAAEQSADCPDPRTLVHVTDALLDVSAAICRPSESLDARWEAGWAQIAPKLDELETILSQGAAQPRAT